MSHYERSTFQKEDDSKNAYDNIVAVMEAKSTLDPTWIGKNIKILLERFLITVGFDKKYKSYFL